MYFSTADVWPASLKHAVSTQSFNHSIIFSFLGCWATARFFNLPGTSISLSTKLDSSKKCILYFSQLFCFIIHYAIIKKFFISKHHHFRGSSVMKQKLEHFCPNYFVFSSFFLLLYPRSFLGQKLTKFMVKKMSIGQSVDNLGYFFKYLLTFKSFN